MEAHGVTISVKERETDRRCLDDLSSDRVSAVKLSSGNGDKATGIPSPSTASALRMSHSWMESWASGRLPDSSSSIGHSQPTCSSVLQNGAPAASSNDIAPTSSGVDSVARSSFRRPSGGAPNSASEGTLQCCSSCIIKIKSMRQESPNSKRNSSQVFADLQPCFSTQPSSCRQDFSPTAFPSTNGFFELMELPPAKRRSSSSSLRERQLPSLLLAAASSDHNFGKRSPDNREYVTGTKRKNLYQSSQLSFPCASNDQMNASPLSSNCGEDLLPVGRTQCHSCRTVEVCSNSEEQVRYSAASCTGGLRISARQSCTTSLVADEDGTDAVISKLTTASVKCRHEVPLLYSSNRRPVCRPFRHPFYEVDSSGPLCNGGPSSVVSRSHPWAGSTPCEGSRPASAFHQSMKYGNGYTVGLSSSGVSEFKAAACVKSSEVMPADVCSSFPERVCLIAVGVHGAPPPSSPGGVVSVDDDVDVYEVEGSMKESEEAVARDMMTDDTVNLSNVLEEDIIDDDDDVSGDVMSGESGAAGWRVDDTSFRDERITLVGEGVEMKSGLQMGDVGEVEYVGGVDDDIDVTENDAVGHDAGSVEEVDDCVEDLGGCDERGGGVGMAVGEVEDLDVERWDEDLTDNPAELGGAADNRCIDVSDSEALTDSKADGLQVRATGEAVAVAGFPLNSLIGGQMVGSNQPGISEDAASRPNAQPPQPAVPIAGSVDDEKMLSATSSIVGSDRAVHPPLSMSDPVVIEQNSYSLVTETIVTDAAPPLRLLEVPLSPANQNGSRDLGKHTTKGAESSNVEEENDGALLQSAALQVGMRNNSAKPSLAASIAPSLGISGRPESIVGGTIGQGDSRHLVPQENSGVDVASADFGPSGPSGEEGPTDDEEYVEDDGEGGLSSVDELLVDYGVSLPPSQCSLHCLVLKKDIEAVSVFMASQYRHLVNTFDPLGRSAFHTSLLEASLPSLFYFVTPPSPTIALKNDTLDLRIDDFHFGDFSLKFGKLPSMHLPLAQAGWERKVEKVVKVYEVLTKYIQLVNGIRSLDLSPSKHSEQAIESMLSEAVDFANANLGSLDSRLSNLATEAYPPPSPSSSPLSDLNAKGEGAAAEASGPSATSGGPRLWNVKHIKRLRSFFAEKSEPVEEDSDWSIDAKDNWDVTALHLACSMGVAPVVKVLLGAGADPTLKDASGDLPVHRAIDSKDPDTFVLLLERGGKADPGQKLSSAREKIALDGNGRGVEEEALLGCDPLRDATSTLALLKRCISRGAWRCMCRLIIDPVYSQHPVSESDFDALLEYAHLWGYDEQFDEAFKLGVDGLDSTEDGYVVGPAETIAEQEPQQDGLNVRASGGDQMLERQKGVDKGADVPCGVTVFTNELCMSHLALPRADTRPLKRYKLCRRHIENPSRLECLIPRHSGVLQTRPFHKLRWDTASDPVVMADILRVHDWGYIRQLMERFSSFPSIGPENTSSSAAAALKNPPFVQLDNDTAITPASWEAALRAAGAVIKAVNAVCSGSSRSAFCAIRPPGHHLGTWGAAQRGDTAETGTMAEEDWAEGSQGFCLLNNVAIGAAYARYHYSSSNIRRIAIIDFDIHHGNGTEQIVKNLRPHKRNLNFSGYHKWNTSFKLELDIDDWKVWLDDTDSDEVFFASIHGYDGVFYPGSGIADREIYPNAYNIPLTSLLTGEEYQQLILKRLIPNLTKFAPDLIFISAGFDGHADDLIGDMYGPLSQYDFAWITRVLCAVANTHCNGRIVSVLEGGYNTRAGVLSPLAQSVAHHVNALLTTSPKLTLDALMVLDASSRTCPPSSPLQGEESTQSDPDGVAAAPLCLDSVAVGDGGKGRTVSPNSTSSSSQRSTTNAVSLGPLQGDDRSSSGRTASGDSPNGAGQVAINSRALSTGGVGEAKETSVNVTEGVLPSLVSGEAFAVNSNHSAPPSRVVSENGVVKSPSALESAIAQRELTAGAALTKAPCKRRLEGSSLDSLISGVESESSDFGTEVSVGTQSFGVRGALQDGDILKSCIARRDAGESPSSLAEDLADRPKRKKRAAALRAMVQISEKTARREVVKLKDLC